MAEMIVMASAMNVTCLALILTRSFPAEISFMMPIFAGLKMARNMPYRNSSAKAPMPSLSPKKNAISKTETAMPIDVQPMTLFLGKRPAK